MVIFKNHLTLVKIFENPIFYLVQDDCIYIYRINRSELGMIEANRANELGPHIVGFMVKIQVAVVF